MNAVVMESRGGPGVLRVARRPIPHPGDGEVLVRIHAAAVSSLDLAIRSGEIPVALPHLPGSDSSGVVMLVGSGVTEWSRGNRVIVTGDSLGRNRPGGYAEYCTVPANDLRPIPDNVSYLASASVGKAFAAAWTALFRDGRLGMNGRIVVIGAADPIGIAAVQIADWKRNRVIAVSDGRHAKRLRALGVSRVISHSAQDLTDRVAAGFDGRGASVVLNVTGAAIPASLEMLDQGGRLVVAGRGDPQLLDVRILVDRQANVIGSSIRTDDVDVDHILKLLSEATFLPVIDSIYPLSKAVEAHRRAEAKPTFGTVLLVPDGVYESAEELDQPGKKG